MKLLVAAVAFALLQSAPTASNAIAESGDRALLVYATINNPTMYDVYVVSAKSTIAEKAELWVKDKAVESMTIPAYGSLELKQGEARLRLFGIKRELKVGETIAVTLETDGGASIEVAAIVKSVNQ